MSIVIPADRGDWWCPDEPCLYCSEAVPADQPAVMWAGSRSVIFHVECARKLGVHLISDAREADLAAAPGSHRALRALRASLTAQEHQKS